MNIEKLLVIRHGDYYFDKISDKGKKQMYDLLPIIREYIIDEVYVTLLSSSAVYAEDCTKIISSELYIPYITTEYLWSGNNKHRQDNKIAVEYIKSKVKERGSKIIILVTHEKYADDLPQCIITDAGKNFKVFEALEKGDMLCIDLIKEKHEVIESKE